MGYILTAIIFACLGFILHGFLQSGKILDLEYTIKDLTETANAQKGRLDFYDKTKDKSIDIVSDDKGDNQ